MTTFIHDLNPVQRIVADAVGDPGNRTFFLQARKGVQLVSLILEKQQVAALAASLLQLLEELEEQNPELARAQSQARRLSLEMPLEPIFRVGQLGLGYDDEEDLVVIVAQSLIVTEAPDPEEPDPADAEDPTVEDPVKLVRFYATRSQMRALGEHALEVVQSGRPDCPLCGRPIDAGGHFCPRTDGHAFPIVL